MHESERCKPLRWIPFAWMPVYYEALAPDRPTQGYDGHPARRLGARLEHEALAYALAGWDERTAKTVDVVWGGTTRLQTRVYLGAQLLLWTIRSSTNLLEAHVINFVLQHFVSNDVTYY